MNVYDCPAPEVQAVWVSWTALVPSGTVAHWPLAELTIVLLNVAAAFAGTTTAKPAARRAAASKAGVPPTGASRTAAAPVTARGVAARPSSILVNCRVSDLVGAIDEMEGATPRDLGVHSRLALPGALELLEAFEAMGPATRSHLIGLVRALPA